MLEPPHRSQSMFSRKNKKNNLYSYKPQFYNIKVRFRGVKIISACVRDVISTCFVPCVRTMAQINLHSLIIAFFCLVIYSTIMKRKANALIRLHRSAHWQDRGSIQKIIHVHVLFFFIFTLKHIHVCLTRQTTFVTNCLLSCTQTPSGKGSSLKGKNLLPLGSKFFPFRADPKGKKCSSWGANSFLLE